MLLALCFGVDPWIRCFWLGAVGGVLCAFRPLLGEGPWVRCFWCLVLLASNTLGVA